MSTIDTAQRQYFQRPDDEKYDALPPFLADARMDQTRSVEREYPLADLSAVAVPTGEAFEPELQLANAAGQRARFTNWSFRQLCSTVGAPASYVGALPAELGARCINHGITRATITLPPADRPVMRALVKMPESSPVPQLRAITSTVYGRVWDAELYGAIVDRFAPRLTLPPVWGGGRGGAYRGDRDSFLLLVDGGSIVEDPTLASRAPGDGGAMYRGLMIGNSEVGARAVTIDAVFYRYICGNHLLWGASFDSRFRRRHVGQHARAEALREVMTIARRWSERPASEDAALVRFMVEHDLATTRDKVIAELRALGATKDQAAAAYDAAEQHEAAAPRSLWGIAQGLTRVSQESGYQGDRLTLDLVAAKVMARARRVAA